MNDILLNPESDGEVMQKESTHTHTSGVIQWLECFQNRRVNSFFFLLFEWTKSQVNEQNSAGMLFQTSCRAAHMLLSLHVIPDTLHQVEMTTQWGPRRHYPGLLVLLSAAEMVPNEQLAECWKHLFGPAYPPTDDWVNKCTLNGCIFVKSSLWCS